MNFSSLGGIMVFVVAALWILVYIPAWAKQSQDREQHRQARRKISDHERRTKLERRESRRDLTNRLSIAEQLYEVTVRVRIWATLAFVSFVGIFVSAFAAFIDDWAWAWVGGSVVLFGIATARVRAANFKRAALTQQSLRTRTAKSSALVAQVLRETSTVEPAAVEAVDPRAWTPNPLPIPLHLTQVGELQQPKFAEVVKLPEASASDAKTESENVTLDSELLDEILRRRRAIG